jgi:DNA-binding transcriptional LysR family regulator
MCMTELLLSRGLKLSHLRIVAALAETGAIGLAAARLGIAQPAASRLLAEVERIAGHPVHRRAGRGVAMTPEGRALALRAARVLAEIADAGREMAEIAGGLAGHVRLGAVTGPALERVLPALRAARLSLPRVAVEVEVAPSDHLGELLLSGRIDVALARLPRGRDPDLFSFTPLAPEPIVLMARRGHALAGRNPLAPADLMDYDWVLPGPDAILRQTVLDRLAQLGLPPPPGRLSTFSFLLTLALLQQSNAIAPVAAAVAAQFAGEASAPCAVLPIDLGIRVAPYGVVTLREAVLTPAAAKFLQLAAGP